MTAQVSMDELLSSFAGSVAPAASTAGQLWYDTTTSTLKVYDGATWLSTSTGGGGGGGLTIPPTFFKAFEVSKDNAYDQGAGVTTLNGNIRTYSFTFSMADTTRSIRAFYPYATVNSAYTQANGLLKFQYATQIPGKSTPIYTNGGSANFYTNGSTAPIYTDSTEAWADIGTDVFALPYSTGVNSVRIIIYGDGTHPNTFSDFVLKAFMPATTEYSTQLIGGLTSKAIVFNNVFEEVKHITMTLNYQGYAWVTNMSNVGATLNFSAANPDGIVYAAISGY